MFRGSKRESILLAMYSQWAVILVLGHLRLIIHGRIEENTR